MNKPAAAQRSLDRDDTKEIPERVDGYRINGELGRGGMSIVYRAKHRLMDREVALKVLDPAQAEDEMIRHRFIREGRLGAQVSHTNVVHHLDVREDQGWFYLALEYVPGGTLKSLLRKHNNKMPERLALGLIRDVACGLEAIARAGVVHRDIKPSNIFMTDDMVPKIADFGVAIAAAAGLQKRDVERKRGIVIGSPAYMAPEQADPDAHLDARADVHALGATLWELLFGEPPYRGDSVKATLKQVVHGPMPQALEQNRRVTRRTAAVLRGCLAKNSADRFQTPRALVTAIDQALHGSPTEVNIPTPDLKLRTPMPEAVTDKVAAADEINEATQPQKPSPNPPPSGLPFTWTEF